MQSCDLPLVRVILQLQVGSRGDGEQ
ncbi:hypothetical protein A2U01_0114503, partial [Trifolium medium]|nr:hypothetical protein [Trifolium medium]